MSNNKLSSTIVYFAGILMFLLLIIISVICSAYLGTIQQTYQGRKCPGHESLAIFFCLTATLLGAPLAILMLLASLPICRKQTNAEYEPMVDNSKRNGFEIIIDWLGRITRILCIASAFAGTLTLVILTIIVAVFHSSHLVVFYNGSLRVSQVSGLVTISREANGNVHIVGPEDLDVYFAQGFVTAQDRLWQIDFQRRLANGTLASVYGKDALSLDQFSRTIGFYRIAQNNFQTLNTETKNILQAYCDGINTFIDNRPSNPPEFYVYPQSIEKVQPVDLIAWSKVFSWYHSANVAEEIARYQVLQNNTNVQGILQNLTAIYTSESILSAKDLRVNITNTMAENALRDLTDESGAFTAFSSSQSSELPNYFADKSFSYLYNILVSRSVNRQQYWASNGIAVSGTKTQSKKPILATAFQPMGLLAPSITQPVHLKGKSINGIGIALVGLPGILSGKNDFISWGIVDSVVDSQDLFVIRQSSTDVDSYILNNNPTKYTKREELISVKNDKPVTVVIKETVFGPIVNDLFGLTDAPVALKWTAALADDTSVDALVNVHKMRNWNEFSNHLTSKMSDSYLSFLYADNDGNIGFVSPGKIAARARGHSGRFPVTGTGAYTTSYVPTNISVLNPEDGFIVAANQRITPFGFSLSMQLDSSPEFRAKRIKELLQQKENSITPNSLIDILGDVKSTVYESMQHIFKAMNRSNNTDQQFEAYRGMLANWNGNANSTSREAHLFEAWLQNMQRVIFETSYLKPFTDPSLILRFLQNNDTFCTQKYNSTCIDFAATVLNETGLNIVQGDENTEVTEWGKIHAASFRHAAMDTNRYDCYTKRQTFRQGGTETVNFAFLSPADTSTILTPTVKMVLDQNSKAVLLASAFGSSGNGMMAWYDNTLLDWNDEKYTSFSVDFTPSFIFQLQR